MRSATRLRIGKDSDYLTWLHSLPCHICVIVDEMAQQIGCRVHQSTRTEAAHVGDRGFSQKCPDREAIPLCTDHHTAGAFSHHRLQKRFWTHWDLDRDKVIRQYSELFEERAG